MNKKRRTEITDKLKKHVTLASLEPGSNVGLLEKKYKIGRSTINKWRQVHRKQESETKIGKSDHQFIELKLSPQERVSNLKKVELEFDNHKCSIEGRISSSQLVKLVKLLEESTC